MNFYYYNNLINDEGYHEVHTKFCTHGAEPEHRVEIGLVDTCGNAISLAKSRNPYKSFNGCYYCSKPCHKG